MGRQLKDRTGERFVSNEGYEFVIVEYNNAYDVTVKFIDKFGAEVHVQYKNCKNGFIKNPYHPSVYGIGCLGQGDFKTCVNGEITREYVLWREMLRRCYNGEYPTYENVKVCDRWLVYANFLEDLPKIENYELWLNNPSQRISLDKDLKQQGVDNKVYSLETVCFITKSENSKEAQERRWSEKH